MIVEQPKFKKDINSPDGILWAKIHAQFVRNGHPRNLVVDGTEWTQVRDGDVRNYSGNPEVVTGGFSKYEQESFNKESKLTVEVTEDSLNKDITDAPNVPTE